MKPRFACLTMIAAGLALPAASQATILQHEKDGTIKAGVSSPAGGAGWQTYQKYNIPTGQNLIFTYQCPSGAPVVVNGAFYANGPARAGLSLVSNFRPGDDASTWEWIVYWPSGAPAKSQMQFNIYCAQS